MRIKDMTNHDSSNFQSQLQRGELFSVCFFRYQIYKQIAIVILLLRSRRIPYPNGTTYTHAPGSANDATSR